MRTRFGVLGAIAVLVVSTWAVPAGATGDDGLLAFDAFDSSGVEQVFSVRPDGSDLTQLTHASDDSFAADPSWSADGRLLTYDSSSTPDDPGDSGVYVMNADGTGQRAVFERPGVSASQPAFFPSGRQLVFQQCVFEGDSEGCGLFTIHLDGSGLRRLTPTGKDVFDYAAKVSHDGRRIAFNRSGGDGYRQRIWTMDREGGDQRPITDPALEAEYPSWAPDDSTVLFGSNCCRLGGDLYTVRPDGTHQHRLTTTPYPNATSVGVWAPSGTRIAFESDRAHRNKAHNDLYVMNADGSHRYRLRLAVDPLFGLSWAPAVAEAA